MAKILNTRIQNRLDTLANWKVDGVELLPGEIALVSVTTQQIDETTGNVVNVPAVLMKVGENDAEGKPKAFSSLPWLSAKAADVYGWAKNQHAKDVPVVVTVDKTATTDTLGNWLKTINDKAIANEASVSANTAKLEGISSTVAEAISAAINALDSTSSGTGTFVKSVTQTDGKVTVTMGTISEDELPDISSSKIIVTPASGTEGEEGYTAAVTVADKFAALDTEIGSLKTSVTGGVHFVGITTTEITDGSTASTIIIAGKNHVATNGDVVIYKANTGSNENPVEDEEKEFIWVEPEGATTGHWEVLGDLTRVGALEAKLADLDVTTTNVVGTTHKFVSQVLQTDGKIDVTYTQPVAADVLYTSDNNETVKTKIDANAQVAAANAAKLADIDSNTTVGAAITAAIEALDFTDPAAAGAATSFIDSISQTDGKITATKKTIPDATAAQKGIVTLGITGGAATYEAVNDLSKDVSAIEADYMRIGTDNNLYAGTTGEDVIIFNCGDATSWIPKTETE